MDNFNNSNSMGGFQPGVPMTSNNPMSVFDKANAIIGQAMGYGNNQSSTVATASTSNQGGQFGQYNDNQQGYGNDNTNQAILRAADIVIDERAREFARGNQPSFLRDRSGMQSNVGNGQANTQSTTATTTTQPETTVKSDLFGSLFGDSNTQQTTGNSQQQSTGQGQQASTVNQSSNGRGNGMPDEAAMFATQLEEYNSGIAKFAMQNGVEPQRLLDAVSKLTPDQMARAAMSYLQGNVGNNQSNQNYPQQGNGQTNTSVSNYNNNGNSNSANSYQSIVNAPKPQYEPAANRSSFFGSGSSLQI